MKNIIFSLLKLMLPAILFLISACEPDDDAIILSTRLKLIVAEYDSTKNQVFLDWNKPLIANFRYYLIFRYDDVPPPIEEGTICYLDNWGNVTCYEGYNLNGYYQRVSDIDQTEFYDTQMQITDQLYYRIVAVGDSLLLSNVKRVELMDVEKIDFMPTDICYYSEKNSLLLIGNGAEDNMLIRYDLDRKKVVDSLYLNDDIYSYSSSYNGLKMNRYEGKADLMVWQYNKLSVIDPATLSIVGTSRNFDYILDVEGDNAGHLFVRCDYDRLVSFHRNNLTDPLSTKTDYYGDWLFYFQNQLLCIEQSSYPDYRYFSVSDNGSLSLVDAGYQGLSGYLTHDFDREGGYLITMDGTLYNFDLQDSGSLPVDYDYSSEARYTFDSPNDLIYRTNYSERTIEVYSLSDRSLIRKLPTVGWPIQAFIDNEDGLIVISRTSQTSAYQNIIIERF